MSQFDFGTIDPYVVDGVQLADMLNQWRDAIHSMHRSGTRPTYVVPGMMWINDSAGPTSWVVNVYFSPTVGDVALFTYNTTTGDIAISASSGGTFTAAVLLAQAAANPMVRWNATGNPIDQKDWRATVNDVGALVLSSYSDAGTLLNSFTFNRNGILGGALVQTVSFETGAVATGATGIPYDDTIPQITEGTEFMTCSITPKSATSKLIIDVVFNATNTVGGNTNNIVALFRDSTADALVAVGYFLPSGNIGMNIKFTHVMTSGTTSALTFRVRAGLDTGGTPGTTVFNGNSGGARILGGVYASSIVIQEVA
jgi:hypothetical protein